MADHIAAILDIRHRIAQAGEQISDLHVARVMILSLPKTPSWEIIKIQLFDVETLTPEIISTKLQAEANRRVREKSGGQTALQVTVKNKRGRGPQPGDECRYCHEKGHWASNCPKLEGKERRSSSTPSGSSTNAATANVAVDTLLDLSAKTMGRVYLATSPCAATGIILDCGATAHMFCDQELFCSYTPSSGQPISVGDACDIPVTGDGSVRLK